jgi:hypothetical protein
MQGVFAPPLCAVPGGVIGVEALRLEGQEEGHPFFLGCQVDQQPTILPCSVIMLPVCGVALIHVDIMDALTRHKVEVLIGLAFRSPASAESIEDRVGVGDGGLYIAVNEIVEVMMGWIVGWEKLHLTYIKEIATYEIECEAIRLLGDELKAPIRVREPVNDRVLEIFIFVVSVCRWQKCHSHSHSLSLLPTRGDCLTHRR